MTILQPTILTGHTLNYIKRYNTAIGSIELTDEQRNTIINVTSYSVTEGSYYTTITFDIDTALINYRYYMFRIKDALDNVLYSDKCFCTDQPVDSFSVNSGTYTIDQGTDNDYIIYEQ